MNNTSKDIGDDLEVAQIDALIAAAGTDGVREIFEAFWRSSGELLDELTSQISDGDRDGAASSAHAIKGSAANVGACRLADAAARVEDASKIEDVKALQELLAALHEDFAATRACIDDYLTAA